MNSLINDFRIEIRQGLPDMLPPVTTLDPALSHPPRRKDNLSATEKKLALRNALRYFPSSWHEILIKEFLQELNEYGRIYMYRFIPKYKIYARPIEEYPAESVHAAAIMHMIQNNLDPAVAQYPQELITYGGNGAVFQNWAQYLLTMQYLSEMTDIQSLHMYSGHPMGLFPSSKEAPRVIITNGMMVPNYSKSDDLEKFNALGVTQYGQMTAGSYMYIGPQGIVHGTALTVMNGFRKILNKGETPAGKLFLTSGLGGMSGAQPKAGCISGCVTVCAEINPAAVKKRYVQGWVDEIINKIEELVIRVKKAKSAKEIVSIAYLGNIVDVWEQFYENGIRIEMGSDQTSLHNPWSGGYYPADLTFDESNQLIKDDHQLFKIKVQETLRRHVKAINKHVIQGTYFFDYGNAFLLEASKAGADVLNEEGTDFKFRSYVQDILGPMCFDYGFGPSRWVCTSADPKDLEKTDVLALKTMVALKKAAPAEIAQQMQDNITWIKKAQKNKLVIGSQARILYADAVVRIAIAKAFNDAIAARDLLAPVVLGRDHHDVSGTDSPFRETSNIFDGSQFTADMAIQNVIGDSFRGATWVSIHNGGGVGWGEVINGGFGLVLDGSKEAEEKLTNMLFFDVNNGIARRSWARNKGAMFAVKRAMDHNKSLKVTFPNQVNDELIDGL